MRVLALAAVTFAATLACPAATPERRVALVVGASAYVAVPHLANTLADATEIAAALRRLGFDVDLVTDPDRAALEAAVRQLGERASGAVAALFFFAGHGVEVSGRNWLLPVSARPKTPRDLPFEALDLGLIFDQLDGAAQVSLFFLDACRDSPFRLQLTQGSRGAASAGMRAQQAASGSLIAYATAPGTEAADGSGPHSPFTAALLKYIEKPGLTVQQVLNAVRGEVKASTKGRQVPWESSALEGDFYFSRSPVAVPPEVVLVLPRRWPSPGSRPKICSSRRSWSPGVPRSCRRSWSASPTAPTRRWCDRGRYSERRPLSRLQLPPPRRRRPTLRHG